MCPEQHDGLDQQYNECLHVSFKINTENLHPVTYVTNKELGGPGHTSINLG